MKPHTIGERLVKPAAIDMARLMCGDNVASKLQCVSLSNDTVKSRIADLSLNIKNQVVARMKKAGKWSYQLDESTDTGKNAQLMVYVRYEGDMDLEEEFLFCTPLTTTATGADIFNVVDNFQQEEGINWETVSAYALTALPQCLVLDTGLLHESGKSILVSQLSTVFCTVKTLLRNICLWIFLQ